MADTQQVIGGTLPTPAAWIIPASLDIEPVTAYASFDGSGAGGAFYPCLRIISDSGHVAAEAVASTLVAAGGSADVSWFQDVRNQAGTSTTTYITQALAYGPWAYYTLSDTGSSTFLDSSGHGRTTSYDPVYAAQGGPQLLPAVSLGSATLLGPGGTSNNNCIASISSQSFTATVFTVTAWIQTSYAGANDQIIMGLGRLDSNAASQFALWLQAHVLRCFFYDTLLAQHTFTAGLALNDGNVHMVAASYDGTTMRIYTDGSQVGNTNFGQTLNTGTPITVNIGMQLGGVSPRTFNGNVSQVGIYDKVLTPANIATLYQLGQ